MFTGLVMHLEPVKRVSAKGGGLELAIARPQTPRDIAAGDSIAVNGVCLTVTAVTPGELLFDVIPETLARSDLGALRPSDEVNVELSLRLGDALGGHLVYGHVDAATTILRVEPEGLGSRIWCSTPPGLERLIADKGYVCLDGVSLTVAATAPGRFAVALIPETLKRTTLGRKTAGSSLNVEVDPVARYVAAALENRA
jgi:riboflavin synthase